MMNPDCKDLLSAFCAQSVDFLVVGAHALAAHGHVRATRDLALWIRPSTENAPRVLAALRAFGASLHDLTAADLDHPGVVFQIGVPPVRIDILTAIDGLTFDAAWSDRFQTSFAGIPVAVRSLAALRRDQQAADRLQDLADLEALARLTDRQ